MNTNSKSNLLNKKNPAPTPPVSRRVPDYKADLDKMRQRAADFSTRGGEHMGLVMADALIRGMRDIGYKNSAFALFELVDNAIQAGAQKVCIELRTAPDRPEVTEIAVLDDGHGMPTEWLRLRHSLGWHASRKAGRPHGVRTLRLRAQEFVHQLRSTAPDSDGHRRSQRVVFCLHRSR